MALLMMGMRRATATATATATAPSTRFLHRTKRWFSYGFSVIDSDEEKCTVNANGGSFTRSNDFHIPRGICDQYMENPFQVSGPRGAFEAKKVEEGLFVRMEMAGIDKEDVKLLVEDNNLYIKGEGRKESKHEDCGRTYSGSIEFFSNAFRPDKMEAEMKNGVLRMVIPKANNFKEIRGQHEVKIN